MGGGGGWLYKKVEGDALQEYGVGGGNDFNLKTHQKRKKQQWVGQVGIVPFVLAGFRRAGVSLISEAAMEVSPGTRWSQRPHRLGERPSQTQ